MQATMTKMQERAGILRRKAKEIALKQAGVKDSQAVYTKAGQDWDDGRLVYKVEFVSGGLEYECKIDAGTGEIVDWDVEHD